MKSPSNHLLQHREVKFRRFSHAITVLVVILATCIGIVGTASAQSVCSPATAISVPFSKDGAGTFCYQASSLCSYINSWNMATVSVNGTDYTNIYVPASSIAPLNGVYTITYNGPYAWSHFEIAGTCSSSPTNTPAAATNTPVPPTNTPIVNTPTRTNTPVGATNTPTSTITRTPTFDITITPTRSNTPSAATNTPTRTNTPIGATNTPTRTNTPISGTPTLTPTRTNTAPVPTNTPVPPTATQGGTGTCSPVNATISAPFSKDGAGTFCWQSNNLGGYVNSWNLASLTINGMNVTNVYVGSGSYPAQISGYWYVVYTSSVSWGHFETAGTGGPTNTPAAPTSTPSGSTPTRTPTPTVVLPGATPTPTTGATNCGSLAICDDFEGQTVGSLPSGNWQVIYPDCQGTGTVAVDSTQAHSGAKSIKVDGKAGYCNHVFFGNTTNVAGIGSLVYGRVFIRPTTALGTDHVTFIAMKDANDADKNLRFGGQGQVMAWNRESDDATVPSMSPAGISTSVTLPINQWSCLEIKVDGVNGYLQAWLNGTDIAGLTVDGVSTADIDAQWLARTGWHPSLSDVKFGWESYSTGDNAIWFDDIAFGSSRIGCGN